MRYAHRVLGWAISRSRFNRATREKPRKRRGFCVQHGEREPWTTGGLTSVGVKGKYDFDGERTGRDTIAKVCRDRAPSRTTSDDGDGIDESHTRRGRMAAILCVVVLTRFPMAAVQPDSTKKLREAVTTRATRVFRPRIDYNDYGAFTR